MTHTFEFGEVKITVDAPEGLRLSLDCSSHCKNAEEFAAVVDALGGMGAFVDVKVANHWIDTPAQEGPAGLDADWTVFVPDDLTGARPHANPAMLDLRERQKVERGEA